MAVLSEITFIPAMVAVLPALATAAAARQLITWR